MRKNPKHNYIFRVDDNTISLLTTTIHYTLQIKAGLMRDATIVEHKFTNVSVYETGGKLKFNLYENYKLLTTKEDQL